MKKFIVISILLLVGSYGFGQKWHLNKVNKDSEYKFEYWFQLEGNKDTNWVDLTICQINSKEKLADEKILDIINCVKTKKSDWNKCTERKRYLVTMHI